jgi:cell division protein FtsW
MARTLKSDKVLFLATLLLVGVSVVMVYSASAVQALDKYHIPYYFLFKQLAWAVLGISLLLVTMRIDYHQYRRPALIWSLLAVVGVALVAVLFTHKVNGTRRWLLVGQPSELAKLAVVLFSSALLERRMHRVNEAGYALLPVGVVTAILAGLVVVEPDFGTGVAIVLVVTTIIFAAGLSWRYLIGAALVLLPTAAVFMLSAGYRRQRLLTFIDPWRDQYGAGFQIIQSFLAVGSGGVLGRGLMEGVQKLFYIPEPHTDFIFAVIAEELGLVGTTVVLACFGLIAWRGLRTALVAPDRFGTLLAIGLTAMITLQAFMNISVVLGLLPTKGIPLPFVSNGGSSLLINLVGMGMLINISQHGRGTKTATA